MNVSELRKALEGLPGAMAITIEVSADDPTDFAQAELESAMVEERCDEIQRLYLWGQEP